MIRAQPHSLPLIGGHMGVHLSVLRRVLRLMPASLSPVTSVTAYLSCYMDDRSSVTWVGT